MPKQLSLSKRIIIELMISKDYSFASIGRNLERSTSTISREVIKYRCFVDRIPLPGENDCTHKSIRNAHSGVRKTPSELRAIADIIEPLIAKGQSLNHICATHLDELGISERTLYNYIDQGVFKVRNIDLPKKVVYRQRRPKWTPKTGKVIVFASSPIPPDEVTLSPKLLKR